jgi:DNA-directed RNA polymerase subunit RPC12/RpoP
MRTNESPPEDMENPEDEILAEEAPSGLLQQSFTCGSCGAKLEYKPGTEVQRCPYCSHENSIPKSQADIKELNFKEYLAKASSYEELQESLTVTCPECAAEITTELNITSQECPYCGTNIVASGKSSKQIKPKSLLPFAVDRRNARQMFRDWIGKLWFAPNDLKKRAAQESKFNGMYVPYWTYDSDTTSFYRGMRGTYYWVTQSYTTRVSGRTVHRTRQVRKIRWRPVSGTVWHSFDDVLVLASNSLPRTYTEKLEPWDLQNLTPYKNEFLSGFKAESYQVDLAMGFGYAQNVMDDYIRSLIKQDIGGDEQRITSVNTQHDNIMFKHILLPIWISAYRYNEKAYRFLVNARTGEVQGERPYSWVKIALASVAGLAIVATAIYFLSQM